MNEVFQFFYKLNAPPQLIDYYTQIIINTTNDNLQTVVEQVRTRIKIIILLINKIQI